MFGNKILIIFPVYVSLYPVRFQWFLFFLFFPNQFSDFVIALFQSLIVRYFSVNFHSLSIFVPVLFQFHSSFYSFNYRRLPVPFQSISTFTVSILFLISKFPDPYQKTSNRLSSSFLKTFNNFFNSLQFQV